MLYKVIPLLLARDTACWSETHDSHGPGSLLGQEHPGGDGPFGARYGGRSVRRCSRWCRHESRATPRCTRPVRSVPRAVAQVGDRRSRTRALNAIGRLTLDKSSHRSFRLYHVRSAEHLSDAVAPLLMQEANRRWQLTLRFWTPVTDYLSTSAFLGWRARGGCVDFRAFGAITMTGSFAQHTARGLALLQAFSHRGACGGCNSGPGSECRGAGRPGCFGC